VSLREVARLRTVARRAGIADISAQGASIRFGPVGELRESQRLRLARVYPGSLVKDSLGVILVPHPRTAKVGGRPVRDRAILEWAAQLVEAIFLDDIAAAAGASSAGTTR
jgi:transcription-repair coupling factor (superfamily II helicase)